MHQKLLKEIARKLRCFFLVISVYILLKLVRVVDWGHGPLAPNSPPPDYATVQTTRCINISKIGKALDHLQPLARQAKKIRVLLSTNERVIDSNKCTL